jgi:drug/metabolite transporter (DMT)-like permease
MGEFAAVPWAILSGTCFSCIGLSYRAGVLRKVNPLHVALGMSLAGTAFFALQWVLEGIAPPPTRVVAFALAGGASQYAMFQFMRLALKLGPLSPLSCAQMLAFVIVIAYARVFLGEAITPLQYAGLATAVVCVYFASMARTSAKDLADKVVHPLLYGGVLVGALVLNSVGMLGMKDLGMHEAPGGGSLMDAHRNAYLTLFYGGLLAGLASEQLTRRLPVQPRKPALLCAAAAALGSISGLSVLTRCVHYPAAIVFTVQSTTAILVIGGLASIYLSERRTPAWYATLATGILTILLINADAILQALM